MGACLCREKPSSSTTPYDGNDTYLPTAASSRSHRRRGARQPGALSTSTSTAGDAVGHHSEYNQRVLTLGADVRELIMQTLHIIRTLVNNEAEPPTPLLKLNMIADKEQGWLLVVRSMIDVVPIDNPLGPAVITLFLDESPLPTKDAVARLLGGLDLKHCITSGHQSSAWHRNCCIVLGCLAEKLAGANAAAMFTAITLEYLLACLDRKRDNQVILFAIIALEKYAQTSENRAAICKSFDGMKEHPLVVLEKMIKPGDGGLQGAGGASAGLRQQVAFCAQWSLDNIFVTTNRAYSYLSTDTSRINAMLNHEDVSEYLKIGPDGLEARSDVTSFESVRCTFQATEGVWFYEATILTPGVMQIGWATKDSKFLNHDGYGIGDDDRSVAYDGCRQLLWYNAQCQRHDHPAWKPGDTLGCLLDIDAGEVYFYLNGLPLAEPQRALFTARPRATHAGFFAAASFMSFQQCRFNFGARGFKFAPKMRKFKTFNQCGTLTEEQRIILPRRRKLEMLQKIPIPDNSCHLCYASEVDTILSPCGHGDLCMTCAMQVESCPLCRLPIEERLKMQYRSPTATGPSPSFALSTSV